MDLSTLLASAIHDMKNQLHLLAPDLAYLGGSPDPAVNRAAGNIKQKLDGIDLGLVRLLMLYRLSVESGTGVLNVREIYVADLLNELPEVADAGFDGQHGDKESVPVVEVRCAPDLAGYFDENLVAAVLRDALDNARRFARSKIVITATGEFNGTQIVIEDDGPGPEFTVENTGGDESRTGLGMHLAESVARAHSSKDRVGYARLETSSNLGGGAFTLFLP